MAADPIQQFQIVKLFPVLNLGGNEISFTNSAAFMVLAAGGITAFLLAATANRSLVPGRFQSVAELSYEFVANTINSTAGKEGMKFFPFVFSLFMFILVANLVGLIPYTFTVTSHIIITAALALAVLAICLLVAQQLAQRRRLSDTLRRLAKSGDGNRCAAG